MQMVQVSIQAFLDEVATWELTLQRESKKLKQLKKISKNIFQINSIDITTVEIESELIQYKKIKDKKYQDSVSLIEDYTVLSKRFMGLMEKIGESVEQDRFKEVSQDVYQEISKQNEQPNKPKHFLQQTFSHKASKEPSRKKTKSVITTKKQLADILRKQTKAMGLNSKDRMGGRTAKLGLNLQRLQVQEQEDLSDVRYQLKEIKSMMSQIESQIRFHGHEQMQRELSRISQNNKKLTGEVRGLKEDQQFILARLQNIKDEINHQKQIQADMIRKFQAGKDSRAIVSQISKAKNAAQQVSQWVRVRL